MWQSTLHQLLTTSSRHAPMHWVPLATNPSSQFPQVSLPLLHIRLCSRLHCSWRAGLHKSTTCMATGQAFTTQHVFERCGKQQAWPNVHYSTIDKENISSLQVCAQVQQRRCRASNWPTLAWKRRHVCSTLRLVGVFTALIQTGSSSFVSTIALDGAWCFAVHSIQHETVQTGRLALAISKIKIFGCDVGNFERTRLRWKSAEWVCRFKLY